MFEPKVTTPPTVPPNTASSGGLLFTHATLVTPASSVQLPLIRFHVPSPPLIAEFPGPGIPGRISHVRDAACADVQVSAAAKRRAKLRSRMDGFLADFMGEGFWVHAGCSDGDAVGQANPPPCYTIC